MARWKSVAEWEGEKCEKKGEGGRWLKFGVGEVITGISCEYHLFGLGLFCHVVANACFGNSFIPGAMVLVGAECQGEMGPLSAGVSPA